jgi:hypothetical protein
MILVEDHGARSESVNVADATSVIWPDTLYFVTL